MTIDDLKIPGTILPNLTGTIKCRVVGWEGSDQPLNFNENNRYSFGTTMHNDIQYILVEEFHYSLSSYYMIPTTTIEKLAIEQGMISKKELPKSFACQNTNQKLWDKYISWLNVTYKKGFDGNSKSWPYYGVDIKGLCDHNSKSHFDTILSLKEWDEIVNRTKTKTEKVMKKHEITRGQLKNIHDVACSGWKEIIEGFAKRNPFGLMIEFTQSEVNKMFEASDRSQRKVLEGIFGEQTKELNFKSDTIDFKVDGIDVFSATNIRLIDAFITLPDSDLDYFHLNPNYLWEIKDNSLIVTRK